MSNIVQFPSAPASSRVSNHLGSRLLNEPPARAHAVQFYDDEPFLLDTVAFFLSAGLATGERGVIVATSVHTDGILSRLGKDIRDRALEHGDLLLIDADALLARFMRGDEPVESLFQVAIARLLAPWSAAEPRADAAPARRIRAFGEMVDLLWKRGNPAAAVRLEEYWHRLLARQDIVLLCGYGMGNFYKTDDSVPFGEVCRLHTHVMPTEHFAKDTGDVFERLREISVLEQRARRLEGEVAYREALEGALRATFAGRRDDAPEPAGAPLRGPRPAAGRRTPGTPEAARMRLGSLVAQALGAARSRLRRSMARRLHRRR